MIANHWRIASAKPDQEPKVTSVAIHKKGAATKAMPTRLGREPLIEAIWQAQFEDENAGELLPGVLFNKLKEMHPALAMQRLPTADIPAPLRKIDPNLQHASKLRMEEPASRFVWQVGDRMISLNCKKPYIGWSKFKEEIENFIEIVEKSGLISKFTRHSLRYLDLFATEGSKNISALKLEVRIGGHALNENQFNMRVGIPDEDYIHNVQIVTPATAALPEGMKTGLLVDIETVPNSTAEEFSNVRDQLEQLHSKSKELFFQHILSDQALKELEAEY